MDSDETIVRQAKQRLGTVLCGKYTVDRILGVGGMAVVYAATHRNQKRVAIKMLHPELSVHTEVRKRFLREGYVANSVKHRGAVDVIDDDVAEDGAAFIVMEYLDGQPVDAIANARGGRVPVGPALAIVHELCGVLAAAHERGIVHRDIKPANMFVTMEGDLKVLDFGIARLRDASSGQATNTGMMLGTPAFMAPEQARGETAAIGAATDVWAAGATLFNLLSGANVHDADTAQMLMIKVATVSPRSLATVMPDVPPEVVSVVDKALAFEPQSRWSGAAAMRAAIREVYTKRFGDFSAARILAPLVGGTPAGGSVPPSSDSAKGNLGGAATVLDAPPRSDAAVEARAPATGETTELPVTASFVKPMASKRSLGVGVALAVLIGGGVVAMALRDGTPKPTPGAAIVEMTAPASAMPSQAQADASPPASEPAAAAAAPLADAGSASSPLPLAPRTPTAPAVKPAVAPKPVVVTPAPTPSAPPPSAATTPPRQDKPPPADPGSVR